MGVVGGRHRSPHRLGPISICNWGRRLRTNSARQASRDDERDQDARRSRVATDAGVAQDGHGFEQQEYRMSRREPQPARRCDSVRRRQVVLTLINRMTLLFQFGDPPSCAVRAARQLRRVPCVWHASDTPTGWPRGSDPTPTEQRRQATGRGGGLPKGVAPPSARSLFHLLLRVAPHARRPHSTAANARARGQRSQRIRGQRRGHRASDDAGPSCNPRQ